MSIYPSALLRRSTQVVLPEVRIPWKTFSKVMRVTFEELSFWGTFAGGIVIIFGHQAGSSTLTAVGVVTLLAGIFLAKVGFGGCFIKAFGITSENTP